MEGRPNIDHQLWAHVTRTCVCRHLSLFVNIENVLLGGPGVKR